MRKDGKVACSSSSLSFEKRKPNALTMLKSGKFNVKVNRLKPPTLLVTLKIEPEKLKSLRTVRNENTLQEPIVLEDDDEIYNSNRPSFPVTLKFKGKKPQFLNQDGVDESQDDIIVADKDVNMSAPEAKLVSTKKKSMSSFFKEVAERFKNGKKERPILLGVGDGNTYDLCPLKKNDFHIYDKQEQMILYSCYEHILSKFPSKRKLEYSTTYTAQDFLEFIKNYNGSKKENEFQHYNVNYNDNANFNDLMSQKYEKLTDARFKRFFGTDFRSNSDSQWCDLFKPISYKQILQSSDTRNELNRWIQNAFTRLSKVDISKRLEKLKKRKPKKMSEMDSFIVNEFEEIDTEEEEGVFVPSLIIQGPSGCGKTSAVYAVMKEQLHGIVFEINSSQSRAKKDISFHLKQIGTTKVVNKDENGLILLDDVELIDEEMDKDFWPSITELLTYSYRPVVMITTDLSSIPANIVEESTVIYFEKMKTSITTKYLDLVASSMGFGVPHKILKNLAHLDLRQSLLELQMFCYMFDRHENGITRITIDKDPEKHEDHNSNLKQLLDKEYQQERLIFEPYVELDDNKITVQEAEF
ncbi:unnamed protein product [Ambrosiozyma monospora]|uniref:Unnamed protein product n=1 Tax=Ambrosiozyma monospora TaxID=43982 RepID=A0ACB5T6J3_AMBMO|nr:unnamed protein product [Ambrosiozyma monospora]